MDLTPALLRNKGVPIDLIVIGADGNPVIGPAGEPETEEVWLRFTANDIADMEERYYEVEDIPEEKQKDLPVKRFARDLGVVLNERLGLKTFAEIRWLIALGTKLSEDEVGARMMPGLQNNYAISVTTTFSLAMGADPFVALEMLKAGKEVAAKRLDVTKHVQGMMLEEAKSDLLESRGTTGSEAGSASTPEQVEASAPASTSSGS